MAPQSMKSISPRKSRDKSSPKPKNKSPRPRATRLPHYKVKQMMKATPHVVQVGNDASYLVTMAAELLVTLLAEEALKISNTNEVDYKNVSEVVHSQDRFQFLRDMIPQKITVRRYKELQEKSENKIPDEDLAFYLH